MRWHHAALTDRGLLRARNEDAVLAEPGRGVYVVADGMGGHASGDVASQTAIASVAASFAEPAPLADGAAPIIDRLTAAFARANDAILAHADAVPEHRGMGTTLTALVPVPSQASCVLAWLGDSRAYRLRGGDLRRLTTDHTWVQRQIDAGVLTPLSARNHPHSSVLTRVLGLSDVGAPDTVICDVAAGDVFLLCTDGLTNMVAEADLELMLTQMLPLEPLAQQLVDAANLSGGSDNITVLLLRAGAA